MTSEGIVKRLIDSGGDVNDLEGLFGRKRSGMNMLTDPLILAHLRSLHKQASSDSEGELSVSPQADIEDKAKYEHLSEKIVVYNRRNGFLGPFTVLQKGLDYEGPIHISLEDGRHKMTKVLQVTNQVTVEELLPLLAQKFNISKNDKRRKVLYQTHELDEILLSKEECPLEIVVNAPHNIRFLMKMDNVKESSPPTYSFDTDVETSPHSHHKHLSKFFGVSHDELNTALSPSLPSNYSKWKAVPGWFKKHQGDELSLSSSSSSGSGHQGKGIDEYSNDGVKGLMLNPQTPKFRRKSETIAEPLKMRIKSKKEKNKAKQRPKSITEAFERRFTRRKKGAPETSVEIELSFDECTPGIIKVFGEEISTGATYKSVLASEESTAEGIIKEVLDRYSLPKDASEEYVLCEVVGRLNTQRAVGKGQKKVVFDERDWEMGCLRVVENNEKPLLLQGFWKPCEGCARRFEIRRRSRIIATSQDNVTSGLNANAKRFQMHRTNMPLQSSFDSDGSGNFGVKVEGSSKGKDNHEQEETDCSDEHTDTYHLPVPQEFPYFINIKGSGDNKDLLCYPINLPLTLIGNGDPAENSQDINLDHHGKIILTAPDICPNHCKVIRSVRNLSFELEHNFEDTLIDVFLEPFASAILQVNGNIIEGKTQLNSGDLIGIGVDYLFIFKNPTEENANQMTWLDESLNMSKLQSSMNEACVRLVHPKLEPLADEYDADIARIKIIYPRDAEDNLLQQVLPMACDGEFTLIPAFVFSMCIEYTAYHHDQDDTKALLCKIANLIQNEAWVKTKTLSSSQPAKPASAQEALTALIPNLRPIIIWMSNSLELLNHLQQHIHEYIVINEEFSPPVSDSTATVDEEVLSVFEEVVMYTFQQSVYYLTKTLYISLPAILDSSPFVNDNDDDDDSQQEEKVLGVSAFLNVFQATFDLLKSLNIHRQILKQLFAYLLFFTNASLFNMLMERGPSRKFFKWSKGVQLRGNLDFIESWIQDQGLEEISHFLGLISTAADLLATPKIQLMQATWSSLRCDFPLLNDAQLQMILSEYQLGSGKPRPRGWFPPPEDVEKALKAVEIHAGFDNHPPLLLPSGGFVLQLRKQVTNAAFYRELQALSSALPCITIETGNPELQSPPSVSKEEEEINKTLSRKQSSQLKRQDKLDAQQTNNGTDETGGDQSETGGVDADGNSQPTENNPHQSFDKQAKDSQSTKHFIKRQDMRNGNVQTNGSLTSHIRRMEESHKKTAAQKVRSEATETKRSPSYRSAMAQRDSGDDSEVKGLQPSVGSANNAESGCDPDDVFLVDLEKISGGVGLGLIDGMFTPLRAPGIYVRTLLPSGPAALDGRLRMGDRILAVNGASLVGADYQSAMQLIRSSGVKLRFLIARSDTSVAMKISNSSC
ncbi:ras-associating and dilute domain-containing protein-like isoform X2 [Anneissia japonica]|uniref:ras-associating and dilute domain-containing protein-like isoform X2 n=1 Tax=Anneissia japonica TaxID=1529436 RepID=UPI0014256CC3|nr:ras-associating and dilute domain-containing protein-like isoform X2 [Anneissia japonica]